MIKSFLADRNFTRKAAFQSVDLSTGKIVIFDENTPRDIVPDAILASASIPAFFPPVNIDGMTLVDGGVFTNLDLGEAIVRCREEVEKDEDIIVDIILCIADPVEINNWSMEEAKWKTAFHYA